MEVPRFARALLDDWRTPDERQLFAALDAPEFTAEEARAALQTATGEAADSSRLEPLLRNAYRRGVIDLIDESFTRFRVASFNDWLGVFAVAETDTYLALPPETKAALDAWAFDHYVHGLDEGPTPTDDRVLTMDETLAFIDERDGDVWLNRCDCRILAGSCEMPLDTCLTYRGGINTLAHRGLSQPLTPAQAKEVVRSAHAAGLVHTANSGGICNCCSSCCYLFRAQARRHCGAWPAARLVAAFDAEACRACGRCVQRCPFGAFSSDGVRVRYDSALCRGCSLCAAACPASAILMVER